MAEAMEAKVRFLLALASKRVLEEEGRRSMREVSSTAMLELSDMTMGFRSSSAVDE